MDKYKKLITSLELDLECPVCLEIPQSSLLLCVNGHHVCQFCHKANKLTMCPTCFEEFTEAKNLLCEKIIKSNLLENLQKYIENIIQEERQSVHAIYREQILQLQKEMPKKPVRSVSTQTKNTCHNRQNVQFLKSNGNEIYYPCLATACQRKFKYVNLIHHLKLDHSVMYTEAVGNTFCKNFDLLTKSLPQSCDHHFFINGMGLFFFKITILSGELIACLVFVNHNIIKTFSCELSSSSRNVMIKEHEIIKSSNPSVEMMSGCQFHLRQKALIHAIKNGELITCKLKIASQAGNVSVLNKSPSKVHY